MRKIYKLAGYVYVLFVIIKNGDYNKDMCSMDCIESNDRFSEVSEMLLKEVLIYVECIF